MKIRSREDVTDLAVRATLGGFSDEALVTGDDESRCRATGGPPSSGRIAMARRSGWPELAWEERAFDRRYIEHLPQADRSVTSVRLRSVGAVLREGLFDPHYRAIGVDKENRPPAQSRRFPAPGGGAHVKYETTTGQD